MRIAVIGYSGAGKSTLAAALGKRYDCPVLHLDQVQFQAGWVERDRAQALEMVRQFMQRETWIIDGNYEFLLQQQRFELADQIMFLNFSRIQCLWRVWRRYRRFRGKTRPDMADGCMEKLDWEFVRWVIWDGRSHARRQKYKQISACYREKWIILRTQRQIDAFLEGIAC